MNTDITTEKIWGYLQHELSAADLKEEDFTISKGDKDEHEDASITYVYKNQSAEELDFAVIIYDYQVSFYFGPIERTYSFSEYDLTAKEWSKQIITAIQLLLNGQLSVYVTEAPRFGWQAAELILHKFTEYPIIIYTASNHHFVARQLTGRHLQNQKAIDSPIIHKNFLLLPPLKEGEYVTGRAIKDIKALTPLNRKMFNDIKVSTDLQIIGVRKDESVFDFFYRTSEFWLAIIIIAPILFIINGKLDTDEWYGFIISPLLVIVGIFLIGFLTTLLLKWRQARADEGKRSWFELFEHYTFFRTIIQGVVFSAVYFALFLPVWTPANSEHHLFKGIEVIGQYPIIGAAVALLVAAMLTLFSNGIQRKIWFLASYLSGIVLLFIINAVYMNTSDTAPELSEVGAALLFFIPVCVVIGAIASFWIRPKLSEKHDWILFE